MPSESMNISAADLTFGVEIETTLPREQTSGVRRSRLRFPLRAGWQVKSDPSIRPSNRSTRVGVEIVSPVLRGASGLRSVVQVADVLTEHGACGNDSCGVHVHVGWPENAPRAALKRLARLFAQYEEGIYATNGSQARRSNRYSRGIADEHSVRADLERGQPHHGRYFGLNTANLRTGRRRTVEFRVFASTTDAATLVAWIRLALALTEKALTSKRCAKWEAQNPKASSPTARKSGAGATHWTRLAYGIGWVKGRRATPLGAVLADDLPTLAESKRVLAERARVSDAKAAADRADPLGLHR